jgi:methylmalonyl-CoA mutase
MLQADHGVRIFSPEDGQRMGLQGMIGEMVMRCDRDLTPHAPTALSASRATPRPPGAPGPADHRAGERQGRRPAGGRAACRRQAGQVPVLGITGTGGAGKSSLTDELIRRIRLDQGDALRIAVISIDPSRRKSGGALLGDRIRMNAIGPMAAPNGQRVYVRSLATRDTGSEISAALPDVLAAAKVAGFDLVIVETSGIGQGDAAIVPLVDVPMYVMTPEFGAASQLEKIDMLDFAEFVAINKFDRKGAADALRDVAKQVQRNREAFTVMPDHAGVRHHGQPLQRRRRDRAVPGAESPPGRAGPGADRRPPAAGHTATAPTRRRWCPHHAGALPGRDHRHRARLQGRARAQAKLARELQQLRATAAMLEADDAAKDGAKNTVLRLADQRKSGKTRRRQAAGAVARDAEGLCRRRVRGEDPRQGDPHRPGPHHAVGQQDPQGGPARL